MRKIILLLGLLIWMIPSISAQNFSVNGIRYQTVGPIYSATQVIVLGYIDGYSNSNLYIPSTFFWSTGYTSDGGRTYTVVGIAEQAFRGKGIQHVTIPATVGSIGPQAFENCGLTSVTISNGVTSIGTRAFNGCVKLDNLTIPSTVTSVGTDAFSGVKRVVYEGSLSGAPWGATYLNGFVDSIFVFLDSTRTTLIGLTSSNSYHNVTIPNTVTEIGYRAFQYYTGLNYVNISNTVTTIGDYAFYYCDGLNYVIIGDHATTIGNKAFERCTDLIYISMPSSVTSIGIRAFYKCSNLSSVTIPNSVTNIGDSAFGQCTDLSSLSIPESVVDIGEGAFFGSGLTSVSLPNGITQIKKRVFKECSSLTTVILPNSVTEIGERAFAGCAMQSIVLPGSVIEIGQGAFQGCSSLQKIKIPDSIIGIDDYTFAYCQSLDSVILGKSVNNIGSFAFYSCTNLNQLKVKNPQPPMFNLSNTFSNVGNNVNIVVPCGRTSQYQLMGWNMFNNITEDNPYNIMLLPSEHGISQIITNGTCLIPTTIRADADAESGYHFLQWSDGNAENPRSIMLTSDTALSALFDNHYSITGSANIPDRGEVSGSAFVEYLSSVTLTATANYGYHFSHWSDNNTDNPRTIVATENTNISAIFLPNQYNITITTADGLRGYSSGSGQYDYLSQCSISAIANHGYHFSQWSDGVNANPRIITLTKDTTFVAVFDKNYYTIAGIPNQATRGIVIGTESKPYLDTVTLTAVPNYGYHFSHWSDNDTNNPRQIIVSDNLSMTAIFEPNKYNVTLYVDTVIHGYTSGTGSYDYLSNQTINATAYYGYHFSSWNDGVFFNPRSITIIQDTTFTAIFEKNSYSVIGMANDSERGTVYGSDTVEYLEMVTLSAVAGYGYHFVNWNDSVTNNPRQIVATEDNSYVANFDFNQYEIYVSSSDNIMGTISGNGNYNYLSTRTLAANANYGYHFTQWNDGDTNNPRIITLTQDTSFTALFAKNSYNVTVNSSDPARGNVSGDTTMLYLDTVSVAATTNYGYHFTQWSDGNIDNPRVIILTRDTILTAMFAKNSYSITLAVDSSIHGSVTGAGTHEYLDDCTVSAIANYGYHFTVWNDGDTTNPRTITLTQDTTFTALFAKNTYTITAISNDTIKGMVAGNSSVEYLDSVTITAVPNYGYHFTAWNDGNTTNPRTFEVTKDSLFTAYFDYNQYSIILNVDTNIHGSVDGGGLYNYLSEQTITATANYGYHFTVWNDGDTTNPRTITLTQDTVFTALFAKNMYTIIAIPNDTVSGIVTGSTLTEYLDSVTIMANPNYGYHFTAWNDGNTDNPRIIVATRDSVFTASFGYNQYTITLNVDTNIHGSVVGDGSYNYLSEQTITATAAYGYHFTSWGDGDTNNPRTITLTKDTIFTALFSKNIYTITAISADTIRGSVIGSTSIEYLDSVTIIANPNYGYHFTAWNDGNTDNPRIIVATRDSIFTATFDYNQYTITLNVDTNIHGSVIGSGSYNYLSEQTITATANYGYHFTAWSDGDTNNPRTITLTQDTGFTALFAKNQYTLTLQSDDVAHGSVIGGGVFDYLDTVAIEATAVEHYHFVLWNDGNTDNPRQYVLIGNDTLIAFFAIDTHHVSVESCNIAFGSVTGGGDYEYGTPATVTATAYSGYQFISWSNGDTHNPYTFAVLQDTTLVAIFEAETQGIDDVVANAVNVYTLGGQIVVETNLKDEISIYDIVGRKVDGGRKTHFDVPASGVYLVKIGTLSTQKVAVLK